ncbi:hypothetical protein [Roseovarius amoyensis]|uniref:hypothetical protein n=1 Tax=Roseovarius amoyensis TaxID=2211448 RepID=UPI000DBE762E|nr:hypothetical protein [Roseovarius amoyensis]
MNHPRLYAGTPDNPAAAAITGDATKLFFGSEVRPETVLFAGIPTYLRHATENNGTLNGPIMPVAPVRADVFRSQVKAAT